MKDKIKQMFLGPSWLEELLILIKSQKDPQTQQPILQRVLPKHIQVFNNQVIITLPFGFKEYGQISEIQDRVTQFLQEKQIQQIQWNIDQNVYPHQVQRTLKPLPNIKNIIAVASGKGGVGKSTTAMNLAIALSEMGARVGILDADIYGPSVPMMMGLEGRPALTESKKMQPPYKYGVYANSIGLLIQDQAPAIWRGAMVVQALEQLITLTDWPLLDYMIVDMPPGTGDIALSLSQKVPLVGAVVVSTPQDLALIDAKKAIRMFEKVDVPILGVIENMALYQCPNCGHQAHLFGCEGAQKMAQVFEVPFLGALPLEMGVRESMDKGCPIMVQAPDSSVSGLYRQMARRLAIEVANRPLDLSLKLPAVVVKK